MTDCYMCGVDLDIEGRFIFDYEGYEECFELCGFCVQKVKEFIERGDQFQMACCLRINKYIKKRRIDKNWKKLENNKEETKNGNTDRII